MDKALLFERIQRRVEWRLDPEHTTFTASECADIDEQIELVEAIWDGIVSRGAAPALTEA